MTKRTFLNVLATIFMLINHCLSSQDIAEKLNEYMQKTAQLQRFSGTVTIGTKDTLYLNKGYGYANREHDVLNCAKQ